MIKKKLPEQQKSLTQYFETMYPLQNPCISLLHEKEILFCVQKKKKSKRRKKKLPTLCKLAIMEGLKFGKLLF